MADAILILGMFVNHGATKKNIRTAEDRLSAMLREYGVTVITSSSARSRVRRLADTIFTIITKRKAYAVAVIPLFGTWPAFMLQEIQTRLLKILKKKIILGIHGGSIPGRIHNGATRFYKSLQRADLLYAPSAYLGDYLNAKGFNIHIIENVVKLEDCRFCKKEHIRARIVWMRAFNDVYNPFMALRVAKKLSAKYKDFKMVMAGKEGPLSGAVKYMAGQLCLTGKILFPGYADAQQKQSYASDYDIYICTNKIDNAPVSIAEFMQFGLPVVSVNTGGIPYMITDRVNGLLVNADDDESMVERIDELIHDPQLAQSIITNAYQYVQRYDEANVLRKWKQLLATVQT